MNDASADAPVETGPIPCTSDPDCPSAGDHCWFPVNGMCTLTGMQGQCNSFMAMAGCTPNLACGCDGTTISVCGPPGLTNRPSNTAGACPQSDAGVDASDASPE